MKRVPLLLAAWFSTACVVQTVPLEGERGPRGETGMQGETGPSGQDGQDGDNGDARCEWDCATREVCCQTV